MSLPELAAEAARLVLRPRRALAAVEPLWQLTAQGGLLVATPATGPAALASLIQLDGDRLFFVDPAHPACAEGRMPALLAEHRAAVAGSLQPLLAAGLGLRGLLAALSALAGGLQLLAGGQTFVALWHAAPGRLPAELAWPLAWQGLALAPLLLREGARLAIGRIVRARLGLHRAAWGEETQRWLAARNTPPAP